MGKVWIIALAAVGAAGVETEVLLMLLLVLLGHTEDHMQESNISMKDMESLKKI